MLRRRRRNVFVLGVVALLTLFGVGFSQVLSGGSSPQQRTAAADVVAQRPAASPSPTASATSRPATTALVGLPDAVQCPAGIVACVDLENHSTWIQRGGKVVFGPVTMLPGSKNSPTPPGSYAVQWKDKNHVSGEFGEAMPFSVFFAPGGIAFHEGSLTTSSHGCVHLDRADAATFFTDLSVHDTVKVF